MSNPTWSDFDDEGNSKQRCDDCGAVGGHEWDCDYWKDKSYKPKPQPFEDGHAIAEAEDDYYNSMLKEPRRGPA